MRTIDAIQAINDAISLASVLTPLVQDAVRNRVDEISDEEVAEAAAALDRNIDALDKLIVESKGGDAS